MRTLSIRFTLLIPLLFFIFPQQLDAQKVLALENTNKLERIIYHPGDYIRFQMADSKAVFNGRIESVNDSQIVILRSLMLENEGDASQRVFREYVAISQIRSIYKRASGKYGEFFVGMASGGLIAGGLMYIIILPIDAWLAGEQVDPTNLTIGAGMLAAGLLLSVSRKRKLKIKGKWVLRPMNPITEETPPTRE